MELYERTSYEIAELLTKRYSTSFSMSSRLFSNEIRRHIYAIYGLVRIADEIVDTYKGDDCSTKLSELEREVGRAMKCGYSAYPVVYAFVSTARRYGITAQLVAPFFASMAMDISKHRYTNKEYETYIYGSAEVVGLMCLKVFVNGDAKAYRQLTKPARALGAAYQKVNFLRDFGTDVRELERVYFPGVEPDVFDEDTKQQIVRDIAADFNAAERGMSHLPRGSRRAVRASIYYYRSLLDKIERTPAEQVMDQRIRINNGKKLVLLARAWVGL